MKKKGFTLIELLIVIAIIGILASVILISLNQSRRNTRINGAKTSLKTVLLAIVGCKESSNINAVTPRTVGNAICSPISGFPGAFWPSLPTSYAYGGGNYDSNTCSFQVTTSDVSLGYLTCDCATQVCE